MHANIVKITSRIRSKPKIVFKSKREREEEEENVTRERNEEMSKIKLYKLRTVHRTKEKWNIVM